MRIEDLRFDCKYFKGYIPCKPNKLYDVACDECSHYEVAQDWKPQPCINKPLTREVSISSEKTRILFIKLGAIGDVIRTTPLLTKYSSMYSDCHFTWVTHSPAVLPKDKIDKIYKWSDETVDIIQSQDFDIALNLDKDQEACELLTNINAKEKYGFIWKDSHIDIATERAEHKLITGLFDHISKTNTKNYMQEIFEICHFDFNKEEYMINLNKDLSNQWKDKLLKLANGRTIIGLNTGCGERWKTRLWPSDYWIELINKLNKEGYFCLLMGGPDEDEKNKYYQEQTNATYLGAFSLEEFIAITDNTEIIVTPVSMMMHIALALKKKMMLFHNIFNVYEFELYNRGIIIEPESGCDCYFGNSCKREKSCMYDISVKDVFTNIVALNKNLT